MRRKVSGSSVVEVKVVADDWYDYCSNLMYVFRSLQSSTFLFHIMRTLLISSHTSLSYALICINSHFFKL